MKVILQKDLPNIGDAGQITNVADGFARNYLIPRKLVIIAHEGSTRAVLHEKKIMKLKTEKRNQEMEILAEKFREIGDIEIQVRVGTKKKLFGSVTGMQISEALKEKGFEIDKRKIELENKIKSLGKFKVKIKLAEKIIVPVTIDVVPDASSLKEESQKKSDSKDIKKDKSNEIENETLIAAEIKETTTSDATSDATSDTTSDTTSDAAETTTETTTEETTEETVAENSKTNEE